MHNLAGFVILLLLSLGLTLAIWAAVSKSLRGLLNEVVKLPAGTTFYLRTFLIGLLLAAAAGGIGTVFNLKADDHFMEYVWKVASGIESVCEYFFGFLLGYRQRISAICGGTSGSMKNISKGEFLKLDVPLPPLPTQQAIVAEIEAEQALVAANHELIACFEKKIQTTLARVWGEV